MKHHEESALINASPEELFGMVLEVTETVVVREAPLRKA